MKVARTVWRRGKGGDYIKSLPISINLAIIFILIVVPFYLIMDIRVSDQKTVNRLEKQYSAALHTAVQDAAYALNQNENQDKEASYQSTKFFNANKDVAIETFWKTMYLNFGSGSDQISQGVLESYVPVIAVTDYNGFHLYAFTEYTDTSGQKVYKHAWKPEKPYAYSDQAGNSINFTLDSYVKVYQASTQTWVEGYREELEGLTDVPLLNNAKLFDEVRRNTIVKSVQKDVAYFINKHNTFATRLGSYYQFKLPLIPNEDWVNSINDVGIMAFIQGLPVGHQFYNNYAFGSGRILKKNVVYGAVDESTGLKYYYRSNYHLNLRVQETFTSEKDAAAAGYMPTDSLNKR